jgi:hypothetical protein
MAINFGPYLPGSAMYGTVGCVQIIPEPSALLVTSLSLVIVSLFQIRRLTHLTTKECK